MNTFTLSLSLGKKTIVQSLLVTALIAGTASAAFAGDTASGGTSPVFTVEKSAKRVVNSGFIAYMKGDYSKAVAFNRDALHQGLKISHKTLVYSNQCAAFGSQGRYAKALEACDRALELSPSNWQAFSNRAAVNWLNGDKLQAQQDIKSARSLDGQAADITYNMNVFG